MVRHSRRTSDASIPVPSGRCNKLQDVEEKGDHIHVQGEGCKDVLLRTDHKFVCTPHHQLGVKHQVPSSVFACVANNLENHEEQVDNVDVETQRSEDVLFRGDAVLVVATQHKLSVKH